MKPLSPEQLAKIAKPLPPEAIAAHPRMAADAGDGGVLGSGRAMDDEVGYLAHYSSGFKSG